MNYVDVDVDDTGIMYILVSVALIYNHLSVHNKEYIERRHGEPFKFLFLPKMGLLGSQAVIEKKVQF
jgi:hypothetical protein